MRIILWLYNRHLISFQQAIRWYPPFLLLGLKADINNEATKAKLTIAPRWYRTNNNGVGFGGTLLLLSDPFPALLFEGIFEGVKSWNTQHAIEYKRPITSTVAADVEIDLKTLNWFRQELSLKRSASKEFSYEFVDQRHRVVAIVKTTVLVRNKYPMGFRTPESSIAPTLKKDSETILSIAK